MLPLNTARDAVLAYQSSLYHARIPRGRAAARTMPRALFQPREKWFCLCFNGSLAMSSGQRGKSNVHLLEPGGPSQRIATATCKETANPAGWILALCSHHLLMEHSRHQRKTLDYHGLFNSLGKTQLSYRSYSLQYHASAALCTLTEMDFMSFHCWHPDVCHGTAQPAVLPLSPAVDAATCLVLMQTGLW